MAKHASMEIEVVKPTSEPIPAFAGGGRLPRDLRAAMTAAVEAWLIRTPSEETRRAYASDLDQFLGFAGIAASEWEHLASIRPEQVSRWRDTLAAAGMTNSTIRRKLTTLRSLFSYLQTGFR
jgi:site-specific recombinase XerD